MGGRKVKLTNHAAARVRQRGMIPSDVELIHAYGREMSDGFFLGHHEVALMREELRRMDRRLDRLQGKAVIAAGDEIITLMHVEAEKRRRRR